jgi:hypothetical protein
MTLSSNVRSVGTQSASTGKTNMEKAMKHTYLVTTAAAALLTGTIFAAAQGMQKQAPSGAPEGGGQGQMQREQSQEAPGQKGQKGKQSQKEQSKPSTTGQAPSEQREPREQGKQGQAKEKSKNGDAQKEQGKGSTTGQSQPKSKEGQAKEGQSREGQSREGQSKEGTSKNGQRPEGGQQGQARQGDSGSVNLTVEQRTRVRETVLVKGPRATNVNFSINIGVEVPRSVRIVEVDPILVEYYPRYRGHFYFIVNDQIIIVDRNHRIVAVINV